MINISILTFVFDCFPAINLSLFSCGLLFTSSSNCLSPSVCLLHPQNQPQAMLLVGALDRSGQGQRGCPNTASPETPAASWPISRGTVPPKKHLAEITSLHLFARMFRGNLKIPGKEITRDTPGQQSLMDCDGRWWHRWLPESYFWLYSCLLRS